MAEIDVEETIHKICSDYIEQLRTDLQEEIDRQFNELERRINELEREL